MSTERTLASRGKDAAEKLEQRPAVAPFVDIYENAEQILVVADLPGVTQEGLSIHLEKGELTFEAHRADAAEVGPGQAQAGLPDYRRSFIVPQGVELDKISADLKDGVLSIHLPKAAALKPRQIPITAG
ncbi:MAG: Hsp20/alpha crystallin family protein [Polyangiaceae bacterium]|nr:Hsp20/alpha crystallin family protein [Polyangiaceae bacterium]